MEGYGMTETSPVLSVCNSKKPRSNNVGQIFPSNEVKIVKEKNGQPVDSKALKPGKRGLVMVKGRQVMKGYYKRPDLTAKIIDKDGWLHTGDLAHEDEDGYYYMVGRKKNLIILGTGENVSPEELERKLNACPEVQECMVKEMGKKIGALICCAEEKQAEVRAFITGLNRTLPLYQRITAVEFSTEPLPRNAMGKLLRR